MRKLIIGVCLALFAMGAALALPPPDGAAETIYQRKLLAEQRGDFAAAQRIMLDGFTAELRAAYLARLDESRRRNEPLPGIDFDPLYDAQDYDPKALTPASFAFAILDGGGLSARVGVSFAIYGEPRGLVLALEWKGEDWFIADIDYGEGVGLRSLLARAPD